MVCPHSSSFTRGSSYALFRSSPNESLDGGAHHAGEQEEGRDQDVEEGQRGKGHSWRQIGVLREVNVDHERLRDERRRRTKSLALDPSILQSS